MKKGFLALGAAISVLLCIGSRIAAEDGTIAGVTFPGEKIVDDRRLELNGLAFRRALLVIKVYAGGFYLEHPTRDPQEAIESE